MGPCDGGPVASSQAAPLLPLELRGGCRPSSELRGASPLLPLELRGGCPPSSELRGGDPPSSEFRGYGPSSSELRGELKGAGADCPGLGGGGPPSSELRGGGPPSSEVKGELRSSGPLCSELNGGGVSCQDVLPPRRQPSKRIRRLVWSDEIVDAELASSPHQEFEFNFEALNQPRRIVGRPVKPHPVSHYLLTCEALAYGAVSATISAGHKVRKGETVSARSWDQEFKTTSTDAADAITPIGGYILKEHVF